MKDGGAAFPNMSLRDWFAGMALSNVNQEVCDEAGTWADAAYVLADAMLAEREKEETDG